MTARAGRRRARRVWTGLLVAGCLLAVLPVADAATAPAWGWLGVRIRDLSENEMDEISQKHGIREGFGAMVVEVLKDTPAAAAGLRTGDLVVAFRDQPVVDTRTLQRYIASAGVGDTVRLTVLRSGEGRRAVSVTIGPMPEPVVAERVAAEFGFFVRDAEPQPELGAARPPALPPSVAGVLPRSRAERSGLKVGDVVVEVNGRPVPTVGSLREALLGVSPDGPLSLVVRRDRERVTVSLESLPTP
jgi:serine protease Do